MEIFDIVMHPGVFAQSVWDALEILFRDNKKIHAIQLEAKFCTLVQGDMTITEYCTKLKTLTNTLTDVGQPVSDETLVLCLHELHEDYSKIVTIVHPQTPFRSFPQTWSMLLLKENEKKHQAKNTAARTLFSTNCDSNHTDRSDSTRSTNGGNGSGDGRNFGGGRGGMGAPIATRGATTKPPPITAVPVDAQKPVWSISLDV